MIDWIIKNKEWLFSGLGIAIFMVVFTIASRILSQRRHNQGQLEPTQLTHYLEQTTVPVSPTRNLPLLDKSLKEIIDDIDSRPLYQRDDVKKHYIGTLIRFEGLLSSVRKKDENNIYVRLYTATSSSIYPAVEFVVSIADYPQLKFLHKNAPLVVEGKIVSISVIKATLEDVKIDITHGTNKQ
jgi:hypothetical protein